MPVQNFVAFNVVDDERFHRVSENSDPLVALQRITKVTRVHPVGIMDFMANQSVAVEIYCFKVVIDNVLVALEKKSGNQNQIDHVHVSSQSNQ